MMPGEPESVTRNPPVHNLGNLWRRLVLPPRITRWSLTSLQLVKHARYYWLLLAEGHLTRRLFGDMLRRIWAEKCPESSGSIGRTTARAEVTAFGAERLCDEQSFVRSAARVYNGAIRGRQNGNPGYNRADPGSQNGNPG